MRRCDSSPQITLFICVRTVSYLCEHLDVKTDDLFVDELDSVQTIESGVEYWTRSFNTDLVAELRRRPLLDWSDVEVGLVLCQLLQAEFTAHGTDGGQQLTDSEVEAAVLAFQAVSRRLRVEFSLPFRDFTGFRTYWMENNGSGSWHARRVMVNEFFEPVYLKLLRLEEATFEALVDPISPRTELGWPTVDEEIRELRRRFEHARTPQDHKDVGLRCVTVTELLGDAVYKSAEHDQAGEDPAPRGNTKDRFDRYIRSMLAGKDNAAERSLARAIVVFSQGVKHSTTPTRREAGIAADSVIMLANVLKRLEQEI